MSPEIVAFILIGSMLLLLAIGVEVFAAVGISALVGLVLFANQPIVQLSYSAFNRMNSSVLTALPLFIFMGAIFSTTGVIRLLFDAVAKWSAFLPGGLVTSIIVANGVFGALCGSAIAATATFATFAYPELERMGYNPRLCLGALASGGLLSAAIPPSLTLIIYGAWSNTSVPRLFAGVLIPGILLAALYMLVVVVRVKLNPALVPASIASTLKEKLIALRDLLPWLGVITMVLGVIFAGVMTATEAAAMGAFLSLVLAFAYRRLSFAAVKEGMWTSVRITSMFAAILVVAAILGLVFVHLGVAKMFTSTLLDLQLGTYGTLAVIALIYIIGGMLMHDWALLLITLSIVLPVITQLGYSPVWFGVWFILVGTSGLITPPFGISLFVLKGVVPKVDIVTIALGVLPFLIPIFFVAALLVVFPQLALWLPNLLYGG